MKPAKKLLIGDNYPEVKEAYEATYRKLLHSPDFDKKLTYINSVVALSLKVIDIHESTKKPIVLVCHDLDISNRQRAELYRFLRPYKDREKISTKNRSKDYIQIKSRISNLIKNREYCREKISGVIKKRLFEEMDFDITMYNDSLILEELKNGVLVKDICAKFEITDSKIYHAISRAKHRSFQ